MHEGSNLNCNHNCTLILVGAIFFFRLGYLPYVNGECDNSHNIMNNRATEINARQNSLGGALDVNGELHAMITQYHNDLDWLQQKCGFDQHQ
jgi:hypothetical protein